METDLTFSMISGVISDVLCFAFRNLLPLQFSESSFFHRMIDQHLVRPRQMCVLFHWSLEFRRALHLRIKHISQLEVLLLVFHLLKRSWFQRLKFFCVSRRKPRKWNHFFNISRPFCKHNVLPLVSRTRCHGNFITQDTLVWRQVQDEHWGFS